MLFRSGADAAVGVRCSPHPVAGALVRAAVAAGLGPVTATSLNRSGEAPAKSREEALALCRASTEQPTVLPAGAGPTGSLPSTVLDLVAPRPRLLREGATPRSEIEAIAGPLAEEEPSS